MAKTTSDSSSLRGSPPTFSGQTRRGEERHEARGDAPANQTPAHLQSPSRGALAVVEQKESHFTESSAAESCAQDANDPALWTRVAKRRLSQKSEFAHPQSVRGALPTEPKGSEADHRDDHEPEIDTRLQETLLSMKRGNAHKKFERPQIRIGNRELEGAGKDEVETKL